MNTKFFYSIPANRQKRFSIIGIDHLVGDEERELEGSWEFRRKGICRKSDRFRKRVVRQRYSETFAGFVAVERIGSARCPRLTVLVTSQLASCFISVSLINRRLFYTSLRHSFTVTLLAFIFMSKYLNYYELRYKTGITYIILYISFF